VKCNENRYWNSHIHEFQSSRPERYGLNRNSIRAHGGRGGGALCFFELAFVFWGWEVYFLKLESNSANWPQFMKFESN
jgi:hypothetical protein